MCPVTDGDRPIDLDMTTMISNSSSSDSAEGGGGGGGGAIVDRLPSPPSSGNSLFAAGRGADAKQQQQRPAGSSRNPRKLIRRQSSVSEASVQLTGGSLASALVTLFSVYFPFMLAPWAASETYHYAFYEYDAGTSHFDNTPWTYGTDYFLAVCLGSLLMSIATTRHVSSVHAWRSRGLLACYMLSVLAGGVAHQFYTTLEMRNTWHFRALWTVCVGLVCFASTFMGSIGAEIVRHDHVRDLTTIPCVPEWFWVAFGTFTTGVCVAGGISFQRPACDIFIAGITQFPSTFYMMVILTFGLPTHPLPKWARVLGVTGFILNAPLLPMYPLLVQYTNLSLAAVNTLLHTWLLTAWGLQGLALRQIEICLVEDSTPPPMAVPVRLNGIKEE